VDHFCRKKTSFFTCLLPVLETGRLSGETRALRAGRRKIPHAPLLESEKEIPESIGDKEKRDGTRDGTGDEGILGSHDAEDMEMIVRGVRSVENSWEKFRLPAANWRANGNSFRLRLLGLADNN
jgi:hypothetical protein